MVREYQMLLYQVYIFSVFLAISLYKLNATSSNIIELVYANLIEYKHVRLLKN